MKTRRNKVNAKALSLDISLGFMVYLFGQLVAISVAVGLGYSGESTFQTLLLYMVSGIAMIGALTMVLRRRRISFASLGLQKLKLSDLWSGLLGFGLYLVAVSVVFRMLDVLVPTINLDQTQDLGLPETLSTIELVVSYVALAIIPPIAEELLFRGYAYTRLRFWGLGKWASALSVSVLFGLAHGQVNVAVDTFILSLAMIWAMGLGKGSLWPAVFIHWLKNSLAFFALFIL
jgi:membrane protease YdiL (CAAX protease family)